MVQKFIIDVDTGVDDAQAIMLALSKPDIQVLGITCVAGNCNIDQVCLNTLKVLTVCDRLDIPVYKGASTALVGEGRLDATYYHGSDGLGDANLDLQVSMDHIQKETAVSALVRLVNEHPGYADQNIKVSMDHIQKETALSALVRLVNEHPGEITLVALAPLTNIALAIRQDPEFGKKLKSVTVMGGNVEGKGNSTICGEFNFACDPDAAHVVLNEIGTMVNIITWELNLTDGSGQSWNWFDHWVGTDTNTGRFNTLIVRKTLEFQRGNLNWPEYISCDLNAMATLVDPQVVLETLEEFATVELHGKYTRGMMVVDWYGKLGKQPNVRIVRKLDTRKARVHFESMLQ